MVDASRTEGFFQRLFNDYVWNTRASVNLNNPKVPINGETIDMFYDGPPTKSGKPVTQDNALTVSAMWRGIAVLGGAASSIPFKAYRKAEGGRKELTVKDTPVVNIITNRPNRKMTWPVWIDRAINHLHMRGNHYAFMVRNGFGEVVELEMWNPDLVEVYEEQRDVYYKRKGEDRVYGSDEVIHVPHLGNGIVGKGVVQYAREDLGLDMSIRDYAAGIYASGGRPPGLLKPAQSLTPEQKTQAKNNWDQMKRQGGDVLLTFGFDYQPLSFKPEEVEFLQAGEFSIPTIARWLGVPPHKLYDLARATLNNIEHLGIEFVQDSMAPILTKFEYEYSDKLFQLNVEQLRGYYVEFNTNAYIRTDTKTKVEANATAIHSGQTMPSEVRARENQPFVAGSDRLFMNQGSAPLDRMDDIIDNKKTKPVSAEAKAKLKAMFNGKTQDILDILDE